MDTRQAVERIRTKLAEAGGSAEIAMLRRGTFTAKLAEGGVEVDNLGVQPFLPWAVFEEAVRLLAARSGRAERGDAMKHKLGSPGLPVDSVEGHIARVVYGKQEGDSVFRRITPVACLMIWAGVCRAEPGELVLRDA